MSHPDRTRWRSPLILGILSVAAWLGALEAWDAGILIAAILLILAGIVLSPIGVIMSIRGWARAKRAGEPIWPAVTGLVLSSPPALFVVFAGISGVISEH